MLVNKLTIALALLLIAGALPADTFPVPQGLFHPRAYLCSRATGTPVIDGKLDEWPDELFSDEFVDITGDSTLAPMLSTRVAMMWDDEYFYVAAKMEEPNLWATLTEHDAVIFHDNDFEVFIDPDNDTHLYYEYEINALATDWDLLLLKPYRDRDEVAVNAFEIAGMQRAVHLDGTLNDPSDVDTGWSVELAFPWKVLEQCADCTCPPNPGDAWRVNFSRVEWQLEVVDGAYRKRPDTPENNWVWSPQGLVAMHYPERWGVVAFTEAGGGETEWKTSPEQYTYEKLRQIYYAQKQFFMDHGVYAGNLDALKLDSSLPVQITVTGRRWQAATVYRGQNYVIYEDGWVGELKER